MWPPSALCFTVATCLLCTGLAIGASKGNIKGDPELDYAYDHPAKKILQNDVSHSTPEEIDIGPDPFHEVEQHVKKLVKELDGDLQKGDPDELSQYVEGKHNHYVNYPIAMHPHHRQKRFLKGIVKGIGKGIKGIGKFVGGAVGGILNIGGMLFGRPQANNAAQYYDQSMRFSLLQLCNEICVTEWTMWSTCTSQCGGGTQERTRENQLPGKCSELKDFQCAKSTQQHRRCNEACPNGGTPAEGTCVCAEGWSGTCCSTRIICDYPGKPTNGKLRGTFPATVKAVAQFECNPGYSLDGEDVMFCLADGTWSGVKPSCRPIKCAAESPNDNVRILNHQPEYFFGEEVIYRCDEGYALDGPSVRKCQSPTYSVNGRLNRFNPVCKAVSCEDPGTPVNGARVISNLKYGGLVNFTCEQGHKLIGSPTMRCLASGNWLGRIPTCEEIKCDAPFPPRNGGVQMRNARYGATAAFWCEDGYSLEGNSSLRCMDDGYWNGIEPKCKAINCNNPGIPEHGSKDGSIYTYPHEVKFTCFNGYRLIGVEEIMCQQDATWSSPIPTCEACPLNTYMDELWSNGQCEPCGSNMHTTTVGSRSKLNCLCDEGYTGPAGGPCIKIECPTLGAPVDGSITQCSNTLGSTCSFSCNDGYVLDKGSSIRSCQGNGQWDGTDPVCSACPENTYKSDERSCLPCPDDSFTNDTVANMLTGCICRDGYSGNPGGPCEDVDECVPNGGRGPCQQICENRRGAYVCGCNIPGYGISDDQHTCIAEKTCTNLTIDDAPLNGGLACHRYREENSQQCGVMCNKGYEFPSGRNNYEYCGPVTGYTWSFRRDDSEALIPPCIEQFYPDIIIEVETAYFVRACEDLTPDEQAEVKANFVKVLDDNKICEKRETKVCDIANVAIICGRRTLRRRKRGVEEELSSIDFNFNITALKEKETVLSCPEICEKFRIPERHCEQLCWKVYSRFLKASIVYADRELKKMYQDQEHLEKLRFRAARREFEPEENGVKSSDLTSRCPIGMQWIDDLCVPCPAGSYYDMPTAECRHCPPGMYQMLRNQTYCDPCPEGSTSIPTNNHTGPTFCLECAEGRHGQYCEKECDCANGECNPTNGECVCFSGYEGKKCDRDVQGCLEGSCFEGVPCSDVLAPGTGFTCGPCPPGYHGDGSTCVPLGQPLPPGIAVVS